MAEPRHNKTEKPTGKRLHDERRRGNVPRSKEIPNAIVLVAFLLFCQVFGPQWLDRLRGLMTACFAQLRVDDLGADQWLSLVRELGSTTAWLMFLPVGAMAAASLFGNLIQGPPPFSLEPLKPDLSRINPVSGLAKIFKAKSLVTLLKAVLYLVLFTLIAVLAVRDAMVEGLPGSPGVEGVLLAIFAITRQVVLRVALLWLGIALLDVLFTRYDYLRNLRMTKQEVKDERKQMEGDPHIKSKIRSKQLEMARQRMMADVPNATVVVTNPTHIAVAIRFVPGETEVPQVLAKGRGLVAARIREIAAEHGIPILRDPPLARALYKAVAVGAYIPTALYKAVAEVLALVLKGDRRAARRRRPEVTS